MQFHSVPARPAAELQFGARANGRILPVYNIVDTLTWTKGKHTITTGINFRIMTNNKFTYSQSYPSMGSTTMWRWDWAKIFRHEPGQLHGRPRPAIRISR